MNDLSISNNMAPADETEMVQIDDDGDEEEESAIVIYNLKERKSSHIISIPFFSFLFFSVSVCICMTQRDKSRCHRQIFSCRLRRNAKLFLSLVCFLKWLPSHCILPHLYKISPFFIALCIFPSFFVAALFPTGI